MTKDELCAHAEETFDVTLNKRDSLDSLRNQVLELESNEGATISDELVTIEPEFLKHPENGRIFKVAPGLLSRGDMIPCDKDGKNV